MAGTYSVSPGVFAGRYLIERELGRGGTAVVYLARDRQRGHAVAIKALRPELAQSLGAERFLKEIRVTQRLHHPHIVPVLDAGTFEDVLYFVLPWMEGGTLRAKLQGEGQLPVETALHITRTIALALDHAHAQGLVHRDVKPENILITSGEACLADFGIARAVERALSESSTSAGLVRGTPPYMSPEQVGGASVDARSDIYSLGCVLYEMLAGIQPFVGPTPQSVIAQRLTHAPPPLNRYRGGLPRMVENIVSRAMMLAPPDRYQTAKQLADALEEAMRRLGEEEAPRFLKRWTGVVAIGAVAGTLLGALLWDRIGDSIDGASAAPKVIVLPFEHVGAEGDAFIADGIADEVTARIASIGGLAVIARATAVHYPSRARIRDLKRDLGVQFAVTGTVRTERSARGEARVRVTPHLVRTDGEREIWSQSFDASMMAGEGFALQSAIAERIAAALNVSFSAAERRDMQVRPTADAVAYESYLRGNVHLQYRYQESPARLAIQSFERAVEADPRFAVAWAKLAIAEILYFYNHDRQPARLAAARRAMDRAFALDSSLTDGHLARGYFHWWGTLDAERALEELNSVRARQPNNADVLWILGQIQRRHGRWRDALASSRRAVELDPRSQVYALDAAVTATLMRRYGEADGYLRQARMLAPDWVPALVMQSLLGYLQGDFARARRVLDEARPRVPTDDLLKYIVHRYPNYLEVVGGSLRDSLEVVSGRGAGWDLGELHLAKAYAFGTRRDALRSRAHYDSARTVFESRVRSAPEEADFHAMLGLAYAGLDRRDEAARAGDRAVQLVPLSKEAVRGVVVRIMRLRIALANGERDVAFRLLATLLRVPSPISKAATRADPLFAPIRDDPRFAALLHGPDISQ